MDAGTVQWINSQLQNDEVSTDAEMIEYFVSNGIDSELAAYIVSQRQKALLDRHYKVKLTIPRKSKHLGNKPNYTPGPWQVHKHSGGIAILHPLINKEGEYKGKLGGYHVVIQERQLTPEGIETTLNEANANLIAAAPELLEACRDALMVLEYLKDYIPRSSQVIKMLKSSISKAEGNHL